MLSREECLDIMGLDESANQYDIETRYTTLLKRYRGQRDAQSLETVDRITLAYTILTGRYVEEEKDPRLDEVVLGKTRRQWHTLWHYGRVPALIVAVAFVFVAYFVHTIVTNEPPDFQVVVAGPFGMTDGSHQRMDAYLGEVFPELENVQHELIPLSLTLPDEIDETQDGEMQNPFGGGMGGMAGPAGGGQNDYAYLMKLVTVVSADSIDVFALDEGIFNQYAGEGAFVPLDDFYERLLAENPELSGKISPQRRELTYDQPLEDEYDPLATPTPGPAVELLNEDESLPILGIDVTQLDLTEGVGYYHDDTTILAIGHRSTSVELSERFITTWIMDQELMHERREAFEQDMFERFGP